MFNNRLSPRTILRREKDEEVKYSAAADPIVFKEGKYRTEIIGTITVNRGDAVNSKESFESFLEQVGKYKELGDNEVRFFTDKLVEEELYLLQRYGFIQKKKVPNSNTSDKLVPEAYILVCSECGSKWVSKKEEEDKCSECGTYGNVHQQLYPGIHTVPKPEAPQQYLQGGDFE